MSFKNLKNLVLPAKLFVVITLPALATCIITAFFAVLICLMWGVNFYEVTRFPITIILSIITYVMLAIYTREYLD